MGAEARITITEKQFLELSDRKEDAFIAERVFGWKWVESAVCLFLVPPYLHEDEDYRKRLLNPIYFEDLKLGRVFHDEMWIYLLKDFTRFEPLPKYQSWQGIGKGIEHANENGFTFVFGQRDDRGWRMRIFGTKPIYGFIAQAENENLFLAFWIAYLKALGVIGERKG